MSLEGLGWKGVVEFEMGSESPPDGKYGSFRSTGSRSLAGNSLYKGIGVCTKCNDVFLIFTPYIMVLVLAISCELAPRGPTHA